MTGPHMHAFLNTSFKLETMAMCIDPLPPQSTVTWVMWAIPDLFSHRTPRRPSPPGGCWDKDGSALAGITEEKMLPWLLCRCTRLLQWTPPAEDQRGVTSHLLPVGRFSKHSACEACVWFSSELLDATASRSFHFISCSGYTRRCGRLRASERICASEQNDSRTSCSELQIYIDSL